MTKICIVLIALLSIGLVLTQDPTANAMEIYNFFKARGWTTNAIAGMMGNIQVESGIISDIDEISGGGGYGLVQWTPKSNLVDWAVSKGLDYRTVNTQCQRIQWEFDNGQQYYQTDAYPLSFFEFSRSTQTPTYLANAFIRNYERPVEPNQPHRGDWAEKWFRILNGEVVQPDVGGEGEFYVVASGDSLYAIATRFGTTVAQIIQWNNLTNPDLIFPGQRLRVK